jgi:Zn-dependent peptidase ImmA (M78 family)
MTRWKGLYTVCEGVPCIAIRSGLRDFDRLIVSWHEAMHHLCHSHKTAFFCDHAVVKRVEYEANALAAIALLPDRIIETRTVSEVVEEFGFPFPFLEFRKRIYDNRSLDRLLCRF